MNYSSAFNIRPGVPSCSLEPTLMGNKATPMHNNNTMEKGTTARRTKKFKKAVSFCSTTYIHFVPHHSELTDLEHRSCWDDSGSGNSSSSEIVETIKAIRKGASNAALEEAGLCLRGLEHTTSASALRMHRQRKEGVVRSVLEEQERQWHEFQANNSDGVQNNTSSSAAPGFIYDSKALRRASCRASAGAAMVALNRGVSDRAFVRTQILGESRTASPSSPRAQLPLRRNAMNLLSLCERN